MIERPGSTDAVVPAPGLARLEVGQHWHLVDLVPFRFQPRVRELVGASLGISAEALVERELNEYVMEPRRRLVGFMDDHDPLALIGLDCPQGDRGSVLHLAVAPQARGLGLGRQLVLQAAGRYGLRRLSAAVDAPASMFFQSLGFAVHCAGTALDGRDRFECIWEVSGDAR